MSLFDKIPSITGNLSKLGRAGFESIPKVVRLPSFLDPRKIGKFWSSSSKPIANFRVAEKILGKDSCISTADVGFLWGTKLDESIVPYSAKILKKAKSENLSGKACWRLVFLAGISYPSIVKRMKINGLKLKAIGLTSGVSIDSFSTDNLSVEITLKGLDKEILDLISVHEIGYRLIDFMPRHRGILFAEQIKALESSPDFKCVSISAIMEACFSLAVLRKDFPLENSVHNGGTVKVQDLSVPIRLGYFDKNSTVLYGVEMEEICRDDTGLVVMRKPLEPVNVGDKVDSGKSESKEK